MLSDSTLSVKELLKYARKRLGDSSLPDDDAFELLEAFTGLDRQSVYFSGDAAITQENREAFLKALDKRCEHYPLQYIIGCWYFMGMRLKVEEGVLCPRDDTEVLVREAARLAELLSKERYAEKKADALCKESLCSVALHGVDLCSGTGCVALGMAEICENVSITAVEKFDIPFECLSENISRYGGGRVTAVREDVLSENAVKCFSSLDFIVSNPPYIKLGDMDTLQEEVKHEPREALTDFSDGLTFYRFIVKYWKYSLRKGGFVAFEIDDSQAEAVRGLLIENGFEKIHVLKDIGGLERCVSAFLADD